MFALNQGEVCTCPSRALVHEKIYDKFMDAAIKRVQKIKLGSPLDASHDGWRAGVERAARQDPVSYMKIGTDEGAKVLTGGKQGRSRQADLEGWLST